MRSMALSVLAFGVLMGFAACSSPDTAQVTHAVPERDVLEGRPARGGEANSPTLTACQVLLVFDGDTFACDLNGNHRIEKPREYIRLLGVDAPETHHSKRYQHDPEKAGKDEPYAQEARAFVEEQTLKQIVYLQFDRQLQDRYGRMLAFVYLSELDAQAQRQYASLNEQLVSRGLAKTLFIPPNRLLKQRMEIAESEARSSHKGLWKPVD